MSLTSYRAAPPRVGICVWIGGLWSLIRLRCFGALYYKFDYRLLPTVWAAPPRIGIGVDAKKHPEGCLFNVVRGFSGLRRPGSDLLFRALRQSTIGAGSFHDRVRNGIGCGPPAIATRPAKSRELFVSLSCRREYPFP